jgi:hypothetical protein
MDDLLQQGITAYRAGKRDEARKIFVAFIKQNPENERGWGWMYDTSDDDKSRAYCLRQMLRINPNNKKANQLLQQLSNPKSASKSNGLASKAVIFISVALVCLIGVCGIGFLFFQNDNKITSIPTVETPMSIEQIIGLTSSAANAQTASSFSPTPLSTLALAPSTEIIPTATVFIFQLQTDVAQPTEYIYSTNTPFILVQSTPTLIVVPLPTSDGSGSACCKVCGANSKPCGDSCISNSYSCNKPPGCACDG